MPDFALSLLHTYFLTTRTNHISQTYQAPFSTTDRITHNIVFTKPHPTLAPHQKSLPSSIPYSRSQPTGPRIHPQDSLIASISSSLYLRRLSTDNSHRSHLVSHIHIIPPKCPDYQHTLQCTTAFRLLLLLRVFDDTVFRSTP